MKQEQRNLDRLEDGAKTITQLVTGLYGVLFAVLALSDQPTYLGRASVQVLGTGSLIAFFVALLAALVTVYPWRNQAQRDNVSQMEHIYAAIVRRKLWSLRLAVWSFVLGVGLLGAMIMAVLWQW